MADLPSDSLRLLERMKGDRIVRMVRAQYGDVNSLVADFKIRKEDVFSLSGLPFFIQLENYGWVRFFERQREVSVIIENIENLPIYKECVNDVEKAGDVCYIDCADDVYSDVFWENFLEKKISGIERIVLSVDRKNVRVFKNERGLMITVEDGESFVIQTDLAGEGLPGGFNLIKRQQISKKLEEDLVFFPV